MKRVLSFAAMLMVTVTASATIMHIDPVSTTILQGDTFDLNVQITDVTDLYAYQFDIAYNSPFSTSVVEGSFLASGGATFFVSSLGGVITSVANTLLGPVPGVSGSGTLATIRFTALFPGTSAIMPSNIILLNSALGDIPVEVQTGTVTVIPPVPEPNSGLLLGSVIVLGLLGHCWVKKPAE